MRRTLTLVLAALAVAPAAASAWAPAPGAIHPGVQTYTAGGQCTANFVFTDGGSTYIGQAAHCSSTSASTDTNGCIAESLPEGTPVEVTGADHPGVMVYNSWVRMRAAGEDPASETCEYNDLALVRLDPADAAKVNPSVPGFGGPVGVASLGDTGSTAYTYGNSSLRGGVQKLSPKQGTVVERSPEGWSTSLYTVTPGIPGDSGSGFLDAQGRAFGTLSTVAIAPLPASNGVSDLRKELNYAKANGFAGVNLVNGTEPFSSGRLL